MSNPKVTIAEQNTAFDVLIIGGGAAGLTTAILTARQSPQLKIAILDGAKRLGAKILISGGGRCNVTNVKVTQKDFSGGSNAFIKRILKALTVLKTIAFFEELGVTLHEEEHGKLFPDSNKARFVLEALVGEAERLGVSILTEQRVQSVFRIEDGYEVKTIDNTFNSQQLVLATGGKSVPQTGSDGSGYGLAKGLGHSVSPQWPALVPLLFDGTFHEELSGISQIVELTLHSSGEKPKRFIGSLLWTHFGVSGPVVLDLSRHWHASQAENKNPRVTVSFLCGQTFESLEQQFLQWHNSKPTATIRKALSEDLPNRVVDALLDEQQIELSTTFAQLKREQRRGLIHQLLERSLPITDSRGFRYAEVTAGGIPLNEVNPSTLESRCSPGLFLVGEILDVDGRLGGFNFQWAWSSAAVAASGIAKTADA